MKEVNYNVLNIILISILLMFYWETLLKKWFRLSYILSLKSLSYPNLYAHFRTKQQHDLQCSILCLTFLNNTEISHAYLLQPGTQSNHISWVQFPFNVWALAGWALSYYCGGKLLYLILERPFFYPQIFQLYGNRKIFKECSTKNQSFLTSLFYFC